MAEAGQLDFTRWVEKRKGQGTGDDEDAEHAYAYALDRITRSTFDRVVPVQLAVEAVIRIFKDVGKNQLLGRAVLVGPHQFPRVHSLVTSCSRSLGIPVPAVYIVNNPVLNAGTYGTKDDAFILVHSALVDHLSDDELKATLGHECGHIHNNHVVYLTALHFLTHAASAFLKWIVSPAVVALRAWSRGAEITSDRAALLCAANPEIVARALAKLALGSHKLYEEMNLEAFIAQYEESQKGLGRFNELLDSHPWLPKRILALRVFENSRLYRRRTCAQSDGLTMREVDEQVREIIKVVR